VAELVVGGVLIVLVFLGVSLLERSRKKRRQCTLAKRLSSNERERLAKAFKLYGALPEDLKNSLDGLLHLFIEEKAFEACGGLEEVTLEMQQLIAAQACLLIVNRPHDFYRDLRTVLVYPDSFGYDENGVRLGESWSSGTVILSWKSVQAGGRNPDDGHDVSLHEFAHQLDQSNTVGEGLPHLDDHASYRVWGKVFSKAFERFCMRVESDKKTVIDSYGATNPAEFFAVSTETFFEKPKQLSKKYPELYDVLKDYYRLDPKEW